MQGRTESLFKQWYKKKR